MRRVEWRKIICAAVIGAASCAATMMVTHELGVSWQVIEVWMCVTAAATAGVELGKGGRL